MRVLAYLGFIIGIFLIIYLMKVAGITYESHHASLNEEATEPDLFLNNSKRFAKEEVIDRSLYHLDRAIHSIRTLEEDLDINSGEKLEEAIQQLDRIYNEIVRDSLITQDMNEAFEYALNTMTMAELRVSERYAESNKTDLAIVALKYAKLHLKNTLRYATSPHNAFEIKVYHEIDSMIEGQSMPAVLITEKIDQVIAEMDELVAEEAQEKH